MRTIMAMLVLSIVPFLASCASPGLQPNSQSTTLAPRMGTGGRYVLNSLELALPCSKLRGRIQLRVLEVRDRNSKRPASAVARTMQNALEQTLTWDKRRRPVGTEHDVAVLAAYNDRLGHLGCKTYDIATELSPAQSANWQIQ